MTKPQKKSGSAAKRQKKPSTTVSMKQYNLLLESAQVLQARVAELEQQKWASNILFAGTLAKLGGSFSVERDILTGLARPWEIRHEHDHENHIYHVRLLQAPDLAALEQAAAGALTEEALRAAAASVPTADVSLADAHHHRSGRGRRQSNGDGDTMKQAILSEKVTVECPDCKPEASHG